MKKFIENLCKDYAENRNFSGVCMLKVKGKTIFEDAYGYANRAFKILNNISTKFDVASITKIFTAVAVLQLIEKKKISMEDKITNIIDLSDTTIPSDVTIRQLLNHTSGIADDANEETGELYSSLFIDSPNYNIRECKDFLKNFAYKKPYFKAGTNVSYCNCSFILLGLAIEEITKMNYREYFKKNIFEKANMHNTGFYPMDGINENTAEGYISIEDKEGNILGYKKNIYSYPPIGTPDGGAYTTAGDLNNFICSIKNNILLNEEFSKIIFQPHCDFYKYVDNYKISGLYQKNGYAFECLIIDNEEIPFCIYKDGINDGVAAKFSYYPEEDITLTILANQDCNVWDMTRLIQLEIYKRYYEK